MWLPQTYPHDASNALRYKHKTYHLFRSIPGNAMPHSPHHKSLIQVRHIPFRKLAATILTWLRSDTLRRTFTWEAFSPPPLFIT